jgi:hypothetical protein
MSFYTILQVDAHIAVIHESSSRFTVLSVSGSWAANELRPQSLSLSQSVFVHSSMLNCYINDGETYVSIPVCGNMLKVIWDKIMQI